MKQRIITAIVAAAIFLPFVLWGGVPLTLFACLLASIGLFELLRMRQLKIVSFPGIVALVSLWMIILPFVKVSPIVIGLFALLFLMVYMVTSKNKFTFDDVSFTFVSIIYMSVGFYFFVEIREEALIWVFYSLFIIWATDSGAYFFGRAFGKRKLWPEISPNKTVEGFFGGIGSAVVVSILFSLFSSIPSSFLILILMTILLSICGQMGDLVESALKRHYNVKDSGNLLPGHGGILDRFDSLLFVWPLLYFMVNL